MFRLSCSVITSSNRFHALCNTAQNIAVKLLDSDNSIQIKHGLVLTISETNQKTPTAQMLAVMLFHWLEREQVSKKKKKVWGCHQYLYIPNFHLIQRRLHIWFVTSPLTPCFVTSYWKGCQKQHRFHWRMCPFSLLDLEPCPNWPDTPRYFRWNDTVLKRQKNVN